MKDMRLLIAICTMSNKCMNIVREMVALSLILTVTKGNFIYQSNSKIETLSRNSWRISSGDLQ